MEVRKGYKKTEVGIIPEDWEVKSLEEFGAFSKGKGIAKSEVRTQGIPCVRYGELYTKHHEQIKKFYSFIDSDIAKESRLLRFGDILFASSGETKLEIGKCASFNFNSEVYAGGDITIFSPFSNNSKYLGYLLNTEISKEQKYQFAQGDAVVHIYSSSLKKIKIPLPPTMGEQKAIADALSDADELIESLDELIVKKEAIKKGAMQELLTGKRRLPGFSGKWLKKRLGDLFDITSSKRIFKSEWRKVGIPFYRARELAILAKKGTVDNELFIAPDLYEKHKGSYGVPKEGDLLVTGVGTLGKIYLVRNEEKFYFKDGNIIWYKINGSIISGFLKYLYFTPMIINQIGESSSGSTVGTYTITAANNTEVPFPTLEEQKAIAEVLSAMDDQIDILKVKLEKAKQIKEGMMQELLTGKTRLV